MAAPALDQLADTYRDSDIGSVFIYTHEAHPGELVPHHTSFEQKLAQARMLRDQLGVRRPILVDALAGTCHRAFGSMPNMTWVLDRTGAPVYKSSWTDAASVESALQGLLEVPRRRAAGERLGPFHVERVEYRVVDRAAFYRGLERSGPKAVREFREAYDG